MSQDPQKKPFEREIEKLPPQDQLKLVERLAHHLQDTGIPGEELIQPYRIVKEAA